jgi:hypothetical protein
MLEKSIFVTIRSQPEQSYTVDSLITSSFNSRAKDQKVGKELQTVECQKYELAILQDYKINEENSSQE